MSRSTRYPLWGALLAMYAGDAEEGKQVAHSPLRDLGRAIAHLGARMRYTVAHSVLDED